jgi:protein-disulfide isomerase
MKKLSATLLLLVGIILLGGALHQTNAQTTSEKDAVITIVEYSDYQCPACGYFHPIVEKLKEKYGDQINLELRYFPLNSHRYAALAARAAQAAKNQGKFKEMHDLIFENQKRWSNSGNPAPIFVNFAEKLDLDLEQFREELNAAETQKIVMEEKKEGKRKGVNSTPTFIIEGEQLSDLPRTFEEFDKVVQKYLEEKQNSE